MKNKNPSGKKCDPIDYIKIKKNKKKNYNLHTLPIAKQCIYSLRF